MKESLEEKIKTKILEELCDNKRKLRIKENIQKTIEAEIKIRKKDLWGLGNGIASKRMGEQKTIQRYVTPPDSERRNIGNYKAERDFFLITFASDQKPNFNFLSICSHGIYNTLRTCR